MNKRVILQIVLILFLGLLVTVENFAHSGRTDSNGGHWDYSTGTYHYHNEETNQDLDNEETEMIFTDTTDYTGQIESLKTQVESLEEDVRKKESLIDDLEIELEEKENQVYDLEEEKYTLLAFVLIMGIIMAIMLYKIGKSNK